MKKLLPLLLLCAACNCWAQSHGVRRGLAVKLYEDNPRSNNNNYSYKQQEDNNYSYSKTDAFNSDRTNYYNKSGKLLGYMQPNPYGDGYDVYNANRRLVGRHTYNSYTERWEYKSK